MNGFPNVSRLPVWLVVLARLGYVAKGLVFLIVGIYVAELAIGQARSPRNVQGVLFDLATEPFGRLLVVGISAGLFGYALWLFARGVFDADRQGRTPMALLRRASCLLSGFTYGALAYFAASVVVGAGTAPTEAATRGWTTILLKSEAGWWLVMLAGGVGMVLAINQFVVAVTGMFLQFTPLSGQRRWLRQGVRRLGQLGGLVRGGLFLVVGWLFLRAGWHHDAQLAGGLKKALAVLGHSPLGMWILGLVALGFMAMGLYALAQTRYRLI
ncbi:DUF1206 domain-containing protein [Deinococcus sp. UYEF24]